MNYITYIKKYRTDEGIQEKELELPVVVNFSALKKFTNKTNVQYMNFEKIIDDLELLEHMFWYSLESGCKEELISNPLERKEAEDVLDKHFADFINIYMLDVVKLLPKASEAGETTESTEQKKS